MLIGLINNLFTQVTNQIRKILKLNKIIRPEEGFWVNNLTVKPCENDGSATDPPPPCDKTGFPSSLNMFDVEVYNNTSETIKKGEIAITLVNDAIFYFVLPNGDDVNKYTYNFRNCSIKPQSSYIFGMNPWLLNNFNVHGWHITDVEVECGCYKSTGEKIISKKVFKNMVKVHV